MRRTRTALATILLCLTALQPWGSATAGGTIPRCFGMEATIVGTSAGEVIQGTKDLDVIVAHGGDDVIIGRRGNDRICGNQGNDRIAPVRETSWLPLRRTRLALGW